MSYAHVFKGAPFDNKNAAGPHKMGKFTAVSQVSGNSGVEYHKKQMSRLGRKNLEGRVTKKEVWDATEVFKGNPYHDKTGAFTSKNKGMSGAGVGAGTKEALAALGRRNASLPSGFFGKPKPGDTTGLHKDRGKVSPSGSGSSDAGVGSKESTRFVPPSPKNRLPTTATPEQKTAMYGYMNGFHKNLKLENERAYAVDRSNQMIEGKTRPTGMSAQYNLTKQRAVMYEILVQKIFTQGRIKNHV